MICSFCLSPAAHPATGCQYGPRTLACRDCVLSFWAWVKQHTRGRPRQRKGVTPARSFYECAGDHMNEAKRRAKERAIFGEMVDVNEGLAATERTMVLLRKLDTLPPDGPLRAYIEAEIAECMVTIRRTRP